jgi:putative phage-type endonuclease
MIKLDVIQRSPEWFAARRGIPTASSFDKIITTQGQPSKQAQKYAQYLAGEFVSGITEESYTNSAIQQGVDREQEARDFYEMTKDVTVENVGLCYFDEKKRFACSPDGLVGEDGIIEIKCPIVSTHVGYLLDGGLPTEYFQQCQGELFITGRKWMDFISYYPSMKPLLVRILPDQKFFKALAVELEIFCSNLEQIIQKIK